MRHQARAGFTLLLLLLLATSLLAACGRSEPEAAPITVAPTVEPTAPAATEEEEGEEGAPTVQNAADSQGAIEPTAAAEKSSSPDESGTAAHDGAPNRLINEKSPYLLQHAYNPIDWYPWGDEAFEKARREGKPIWLSIGYSTCHWCHVMEEESYNDPEVAALMNETFVAIKVDREERPDIDNLYMNVAMMMNGSGGWPLNVIMTPDKKPFYVATYIPKESRFQRMGMLELIPRVQESWTGDRDALVDIGEQIAAALQPRMSQAGADLDEDTLAQAYEDFSERYDPVNGGFGSQPKFPSPQNLLFLLRYWQRTGDGQALQMVEATLQAMRRGGVYDQVGYGFHRYSTDATWFLPHFEKMLYDQAMQAMGYTEAYLATGNPQYQATAEEIFTYVLRDMTAPEGPFFSAEDADSEGEEGVFYHWTTGEIEEILTPDDAALAITVYGLVDEGNFVDEAARTQTGANVLALAAPLDELAAEQGISEEELSARLEDIRQTLFDVREARIHPYKDDKVLSDWNGLMISALARGAQAFDAPEYADAAVKAADFILDTLVDEDGRLLHRYRDGDAAIMATVDDYAFLVAGLLDLYEATFDIRYLTAARDLNEQMVTHFWDESEGGLFLTADDAEELLVRAKEVYDGAIPSGNSVAMLNLLRLGRMTGDTAYEERAAALSRAFSGQVALGPAGYGQLLSAVDFAIGPSLEIVIVGEAGADDTGAMLAGLRGRYLPNKIVLLRTPGDDAAITELAEFTRYQYSLDDRATAYVCRNFECEFPTTDVGEMVVLTQEP